MNFPKHIQNIPENKQAIAPYNFVELSDQVVTAQLEPNGKLRDNNCYYSDRNTGKIECTLTTSSPLYIRCGLTKEQFKEKEKANGEAKDIPEFYYIDPDTKQPVIPGSSLRGMLRTLVEIISFSKITKVSDQKLIYRAVGDTSSLGVKYREKLLQKQPDGSYHFLMQAGYLINSGININNNWKIYPAQPLIQGVLFARIERDNIPTQLPSWYQCKNSNHIAVKVQTPTIHSHNRGRIKLKYAKALPNPVQKKELYNSVLVKTGSSPKKHMEFVFGLPSKDESTAIDIHEDLIEEYKNQVTDGQIEILGNKEGALNNMQPVFYIKENNKLIFFGHPMMFRIPYDNSLIDFVPDELSELKNPKQIDIADAIFGWVRQNDEQNKLSKEIKQRAGRIFISDAKCVESSNNIWYTGNPYDITIPHILASPKPTTFQHYLVQSEETNAEKEKLKHYGSKPIKETVIRGHKLYWHKGNSPQIKHPNSIEANESQLTAIKPINTDVKFNFTIHFENLTNIELGALIWVLNIAQDESYRLKLGMGKPLGMGAVKIEHNLYLSDRQIRYTQLFNDDQWETAEQIKENLSYQQDFEKYILEQICPQSNFKDIPRIRMLLEMLRWPGPVDIERKTRYMEIERNKDNEYKKRPVLPTPLQVVGIELTNTPFLSPINSNLPENISQKFSQGQEVDAQVIDIEPKSIQKGNKTEPMTIITYQIQGSDCKSTEEIRKHEIDLQLGMTVKVRIDKVKNNNVRRVKRVGIVE